MSADRALVLLGPAVSRVAVRGRAGWRWLDAIGEVHSHQGQIERIVSALRENGFTGGGVVLGVPASRCLAASFDAADLPRDDYKARLFRLEEHLPLSAEQVAAEFVNTTKASADQHALGIAIERQWLAAQVDALEAAGLSVDFIVPSTLLAAVACEGNASDVLLVREPTDSQLQIISCDQKRVANWLRVPCAAGPMSQALQSLRAEGRNIETPAAVGDLPADVLSGQRIVVSSHDFQSLATAAADELFGGRSPVINFRRNGMPAADRFRLQRRAINAALAGVAVLLAFCSISLWLRAARYGAASEQNQQLMMTHFHQALPGWPTPSNFRAIVASERRRLLPNVESMAATSTAAAMMNRVLRRLPMSDEVSLTDMAFTSSHFDLSGVSKHYESAAPLGEAARAAGLEVTPIQAHRQADDSWQFSVGGQLGATAKAGAP